MNHATPASASTPRPYKSVAAALLLCIFFGPVGLLYASLWGGCLLTLKALYVTSNTFWMVTGLLWVVCCVWSVAATERYNKKIAAMRH